MLRQDNITRQSSASSIDGTDGRNINKQASRMSGVTDRSVARASCIHLSKINALKASIDEHNDAIVRLLLTSKETAEKRNQIESTFRFCKEAFLEVATTLTCLLEESSADKTEVIKNKPREIYHCTGRIGRHENAKIPIYTGEYDSYQHL